MVCFDAGNTTQNEVFLMAGGIHTNEAEAVTVDLARGLVSDFAAGRLTPPDGVTACVVPALNPDGLARRVHTNANGVDLNRNWPSADWSPEAWHPVFGSVSAGHRALSEPETRALYDLIELVRPSAVIVYHCCGALTEANSRADAVFMARRYAEAAGLDYLSAWEMYDISGEFIDAMDELGVPAIDIELRTSGATDVEHHRAGVRSVLDYLAGRPPR